MSVTLHRLGRVEYIDGLELQRQLQEARRANVLGDMLLLLEHNPVLTLGRGAKAMNVLASPEVLAAQGVELVETDRGGDVTYHGPGQLVGYPLLFLPPGRQDVRRYVRMIEETIIRALRRFGLEATRFEQWPGVWIAESRRGGPRKIAALGVHLSRWYTRHGFALNVAPNLGHFSLIVPCGIREAGVTSMAEELGHAPGFDEVQSVVAETFGEVFEQPLEPAPERKRTVAVAVRRGEQVLLLKRSEARGGFWQLVTGSVEAGEGPLAAAGRELVEETGISGPARPLDYVHSFALGTTSPPVLLEEHGFVAQASAEHVRLSAEHETFEWVGRAEALARLPFAGLREVVRRAYNDNV